MKDSFEDIDLDLRILDEYNVKMSIGFLWLWVGYNGWLLHKE
jgi:hypothetical protein